MHITGLFLAVVLVMLWCLWQMRPARDSQLSPAAARREGLKRIQLSGGDHS